MDQNTSNAIRLLEWFRKVYGKEEVDKLIREMMEKYSIDEKEE